MLNPILFSLYKLGAVLGAAQSWKEGGIALSQEKEGTVLTTPALSCTGAAKRLPVLQAMFTIFWLDWGQAEALLSVASSCQCS